MKRTEKEEIKKDKATAVKNSGRGFRKGDATLGQFVVDYKHNGSTYTLTKEAWVKMRKDSFRSNYKHPCISVVLGQDSDVKVAIIDWELFRHLILDTEYE